MAFGELFGEEKGRADTAFALHRAATANSEIGRVRQIISEATLVRGSQGCLCEKTVPFFPPFKKSPLETRHPLVNETLPEDIHGCDP